MTDRYFRLALVLIIILVIVGCGASKKENNEDKSLQVKNNVLETVLVDDGYRIVSVKDSVSSIESDYKDLIQQFDSTTFGGSTFGENWKMRYFPSSTEEIIKYLVVDIENNSHNTTGVIEIMPSREVSVGIPYSQLVAIFNRKRINSEEDSNKKIYNVYGFIGKKAFVWLEMTL